VEKLFLLSDLLLNEKIHIDAADNIELLLGQIFLNRIVGIACKNLDFSSMYHEAQKVLKTFRESEEQKCLCFQKKVCCLSEILQSAQFKYALLKGAFLSTVVYEHGQRTSNDIDILCESKDVSKLQSLLIENGFIQGHYEASTNAIVPASRREIIESKMNFGETIPFLTMLDGQPLEVDINFSVDFKAIDERGIVQELLRETTAVQLHNFAFQTLNMVDFIIHLCCHLYKEATTYDWVRLRRDLMLYKFSDMNAFLHKYGNHGYFDELIKRVKFFGVEKECYYSFENSSVIYPKLNEIDGFTAMKKNLQPFDLNFMKQIVYPREKKLFQHNMDFANWFFCPDRIAQLEEISYEAD